MIRIAILALLLGLFATITVKAEDWVPDTEYKVNALANAIFRAENSKSFPYGIKSIPIKGDTQDEREAYARRICKNTIRNNIRRYRGNHRQSKAVDKQLYSISYLEFLQSRYCPTSGDLSKSEKELNGNWLKNVKYFLKQELK